jgi:hypothetical protein
MANVNPWDTGNEELAVVTAQNPWDTGSEVLAIPIIEGGTGEGEATLPQTEEPTVKEKYHMSMWDDMDKSDADAEYARLESLDETVYDEKSGFLVVIPTDQNNLSRPVTIPKPETVREGIFGGEGIFTKEEMEDISNVSLLGGASKDNSQREMEEMAQKGEIPSDPSIEELDMLGLSPEATTGVGQKLLASGFDASGEWITFGGSVIDLGIRMAGATSEKLGGPEITSDLGEKIVGFGQSFPDAKTQNLGDLLLIEALPLANAYGLGRSVVKKVSAEAPKYKQYLMKAFREASGTLALVSGMEAETGGLLVGEDAMLQIWDGFEKGDTVATSKLANTANLFADALVASGIFNTVAYPIAFTYNTVAHGMVSPLYSITMKGTDAKRKELMAGILQKLTSHVDNTSVTGIANNENKQILMREIVETLQENSEIFIEMGKNKPIINLQVDVATVLKNSIRNNPEKAEKLNPVIQKLEQFAKGFEGTGGPLSTSRSSVITQAEKALDQVEGVAFNDIANASENIVEAKRVDLNIAPGADNIKNLEATVETLSNNIVKEMPLNLELGSKVDSLLRNSSSNPLKANTKVQTSRNLAEQLDEAATILTNKKNELASKISGGAVNKDGLYAILKAMNDIPNLTKMASEVSSSKPLSSLLKIFSIKTKKVKGKKAPQPKTDADYLVDLENLIKKNKLDFGKLHNEVRPELVSLINSSEGPIKAQLINLKRFIDDDSVQFLSQTGDNVLAQDAQAFMKFYVDEFAPYFKQNANGVDDPLSSWYSVWQETARPKKGELSSSAGTSLKPRAFEEKTFELLEEISQNPLGRTSTASDIAKLLKTSPNSDPDKLFDYMLHDIVQSVQVRVSATGGIDDLAKNEITSLGNQLSQFVTLMERSGFSEKAKNLNSFIAKLNQTSDNSSLLVKTIKEEADKLKINLDKAKKDDLKDFWTVVKREGVDVDIAPTLEPEKAFEKLLKTDDGNTIKRVQEVVRIAEGLDSPLTLNALRSYYAKYVSDLAFGQKTASGARSVSLSKTNESKRQFGTILEAGKIIFRESKGEFDSQTMAGLEQFIKIARGVDEGRTSFSIGQSQTAAAVAAQSAVNGLVKVFIGPLTRPGARITAFSGSIIKSLDSDEILKKLTEDMLANPAEFKRLANANINWLNPEVKETMWRAAVRSSLYSDDDRKEFNDLWDVAKDTLGILKEPLEIVENAAKNLKRSIQGPDSLMGP